MSEPQDILCPCCGWRFGKMWASPPNPNVTAAPPQTVTIGHLCVQCGDPLPGPNSTNVHYCRGSCTTGGSR